MGRHAGTDRVTENETKRRVTLRNPTQHSLPHRGRSEDVCGAVSVVPNSEHTASAANMPSGAETRGFVGDGTPTLHREWA